MSKKTGIIFPIVLSLVLVGSVAAIFALNKKSSNETSSSIKQQQTTVSYTPPEVVNSLTIGELGAPTEKVISENEKHLVFHYKYTVIGTQSKVLTSYIYGINPNFIVIDKDKANGYIDIEILTAFTETAIIHFVAANNAYDDIELNLENYLIDEISAETGQIVF